MSYKPKILEVAAGGTGAATLTGVLTGNGTSAVTANTVAQYSVLIGGASNAVATVAAAAAGKVLQSGGVSANPAYSTATFPSTATTIGTLLRADGNNWVATTSTYPDTNAVSTLLYASSANVISALATANNGLLVTSNSGVPSILAGPGATGRILQSNSAAAPSFSTSTYPSTNAVNTLLYASSANVMAALATANSAVLATDGSGVPSLTATPSITSITLSGGTALSTFTQGTFSPTIQGTSTGGATTYTLQVGRYQRIGRIVTVELSVGWSAATGTGAILVGALPFTSVASPTFVPFSFGAGGTFLIATATMTMPMQVGNSTNVRMWGYITSTGTIVDSNLASNTNVATLYLTGSYEV